MCVDGDLAIVRQRAEERRRQQQTEASLEMSRAEEERLILLEVEAFIRAEEEREAQEAEEARLLAEAERQRREEERIIAVHKRFQRFNAELEVLNSVQKALLTERHEHNTQVLQTEHQNILDSLSVRHTTELHSAAQESKTKIADTKERFVFDFSTRKAEEMRVEEQYTAELRAYWTGKPDAEYKIASQLDELRDDQKKHYWYWDSHRKTVLKTLIDEEKRSYAALKMRQSNEVGAAELRTKSKSADWERRKGSEMMWFSVVSSERIAMLEELQAEEYAMEV